jgi:hypothetical protein
MALTLKTYSDASSAQAAEENYKNALTTCSDWFEVSQQKPDGKTETRRFQVVDLTASKDHVRWKLACSSPSHKEDLPSGLCEEGLSHLFITAQKGNGFFTLEVTHNGDIPATTVDKLVELVKSKLPS